MPPRSAEPPTSTPSHAESLAPPPELPHYSPDGRLVDPLIGTARGRLIASGRMVCLSSTSCIGLRACGPTRSLLPMRVGVCQFPPCRVEVCGQPLGVDAVRRAEVHVPGAAAVVAIREVDLSVLT